MHFFILCSFTEPHIQDGWTWLPNRYVLVIERKTLLTKVEPLRPRGATSAPLPALMAAIGR